MTTEVLIIIIFLPLGYYLGHKEAWKRWERWRGERLGCACDPIGTCLYHKEEERKKSRPEGCYCHETLQPDKPFGGNICPVCEFGSRTEGR